MAALSVSVTRTAPLTPAPDRSSAVIWRMLSLYLPAAPFVAGVLTPFVAGVLAVVAPVRPTEVTPVNSGVLPGLWPARTSAAIRCFSSRASFLPDAAVVYPRAEAPCADEPLVDVSVSPVGVLGFAPRAKDTVTGTRSLVDVPLASAVTSNSERSSCLPTYGWATAGIT